MHRKIRRMITLALLLCFGAAHAAAQAEESAGPDAVLRSMVINPQLVYAETQEDLARNGGETILSTLERGQSCAEGAVFAAAAGENPFLTFAQPMSSMQGIQADGNRIFYITIKPSAKDFGCMLFATLNIGLTIGAESEPIAFVMAENDMRPLDTELRIEPGHWYHMLLAVGRDGMFAGALWKDGGADSTARFAIDLRAYDNPDYLQQPWEAMVGFAGEAAMTIREYAYYTFDGFADEIMDN